jgi:hypothetical protein
MTDGHAADDGVGSAEAELMRSSAVFLTELERIAEMERRKRALAPGDAERPGLAHEIEDATGELLALSRYQTRLIELEHDALRGSTPPVQPRPVHVILEDWRAAERDLYDARTAMERAGDLADRLRREHQGAVDSRRGPVED